MIEDISTIVWKEAREFLLQRATFGKGVLIGLVMPIAVLGVFLPWMNGPGWVAQPGWLAMLVWMPIMIAISMVADSFAGERERRTLETLLASRLSDRAILNGKIAAAVLFSWGLTVASLVVGLITVNLVHGHGRLLMFPPRYLAGVLVFSLLFSLLAGCAGVLVSLRAATVRQAAQTLSFGFMILIFGAIFGARALPAAWVKAALGAVAGGQLLWIAVAAALILVALDLALYLWARARFQRARLILD